MISDAIRGYLGRHTAATGRATLRALRPEAFSDGNEGLCSEIDGIVYGSVR